MVRREIGGASLGSEGRASGKGQREGSMESDEVVSIMLQLARRVVREVRTPRVSILSPIGRNNRIEKEHPT